MGVEMDLERAKIMISEVKSNRPSKLEPNAYPVVTLQPNRQVDVNHDGQIDIGMSRVRAAANTCLQK